jgi:hypothetical protein
MCIICNQPSPSRICKPCEKQGRINDAIAEMENAKPRPILGLTNRNKQILNQHRHESLQKL